MPSFPKNLQFLEEKCANNVCFDDIIKFYEFKNSEGEKLNTIDSDSLLELI